MRPPHRPANFPNPGVPQIPDDRIRRFPQTARRRTVSNCLWAICNPSVAPDRARTASRRAKRRPDPPPTPRTRQSESFSSSNSPKAKSQPPHTSPPPNQHPSRQRHNAGGRGGAEATRSAYLHDYLRLPLRPLQVTRIGGSGADPAACGTSSSRPAVQTPRRPPSAFHARNIRRRCGADKRICLYICRRFLFPEPNKKPKTDGIQFQRAGIQVAAILERT